jgi:hypothetical protein
MFSIIYKNIRMADNPKGPFAWLGYQVAIKKTGAQSLPADEPKGLRILRNFAQLKDLRRII